MASDRRRFVLPLLAAVPWLIGAQPKQPADTPPPPPAPYVPAQAGVWQPKDTAEISALNKISARYQTLTIKVGQSATFGALTINVSKCVARAPDQPIDAAAFLIVEDKRPGGATFKGWMFAKEPEASMMENAIYDVRVESCH